MNIHSTLKITKKENLKEMKRCRKLNNENDDKQIRKYVKVVRMGCFYEIDEFKHLVKIFLIESLLPVQHISEA